MPRVVPGSLQGWKLMQMASDLLSSFIPYSYFLMEWFIELHFAAKNITKLSV